MKITKSSIQKDLMGQGHVIYVHIETIDTNDDPIKIKLIAMINKYELTQFKVEPSWSGIKFTRQQVFSIINKLYPAECMSLNIGYLDDMRDMIPKMDKKSELNDNWDEDVPGEPDKDSLIQDLVRRNINLIQSNIIMVHKGEKYYEASLQSKDRVSNEIISLFEEYKNIS